jgi:hypothetical protein
MLHDPQIAFALGIETANGGDQPDECVEANERKSDNRPPFGAVIHSNWQKEKHNSELLRPFKRNGGGSQAFRDTLSERGVYGALRL